MSVAEAAIARGGHVRTGFEDVRYVAPGELAESNAQLVEKIADLAGRAGRGLATPEESRAILGIESQAR
jgi:3-keto-5-aminohexanoate cleavage enzyme